MEDLLDLLMQLYSTSGKARAMAIRIGLPLALLDLTGSLMECWVEILEQARLRSKVHELVRLVCKDFAERSQEVKAATETYRRSTSMQWPPAREASNGLKTLAEIVGSTAIPEGAVVYSVVFQSVSRQIAIVTAYKLMHDRLHVLERECYRRIAAARGDSSGEADWKEVRDAYRSLYQIVQELNENKETSDGLLRKSETNWITDVVLAGKDLAESIALQRRISRLPSANGARSDDGERKSYEQASRDGLQSAISRLGRVLLMQPTPISLRINQAAQDVALDRLVSTLEEIATVLDLSSTDQANLEQFQTGFAGLKRLKLAVDAAVDEHNRWQSIDMALRLIEASLPSDIREFTVLWADLRERTLELCQGHNDESTERFRKEIDSLDGAFSARNPAQIRAFFDPFRKGASDRFFDSDSLLLNLIKSLGGIKESLDEVVGVLK